MATSAVLSVTHLSCSISHPPQLFYQSPTSAVLSPSSQPLQLFYQSTTSAVVCQPPWLFYQSTTSAVLSVNHLGCSISQPPQLFYQSATSAVLSLAVSMCCGSHGSHLNAFHFPPANQTGTGPVSRAAVSQPTCTADTHMKQTTNPRM